MSGNVRVVFYILYINIIYHPKEKILGIFVTGKIKFFIAPYNLQFCSQKTLRSRGLVNLAVEG